MIRIERPATTGPRANADRSAPWPSPRRIVLRARVGISCLRGFIRLFRVLAIPFASE